MQAEVSICFGARGRGRGDKQIVSGKLRFTLLDGRIIAE
jgi:hypothetical protein